MRLELVAMSSVFLVGVAVFTLGLVAVNVGMRTETSLHKLLKLEHVGPPFLMPKFDPKMVIVTAALNGADGAGLTFVIVPMIMVIAGGEY